MDALEQAILRTVLYADVFNFPMTAAEIAHFLIADTPIPLARIEQALASSNALRHALESTDGLYYCAGRGELVAMRRSRERISAQLWSPAFRYGRWLGSLPFVRMVALTGALAMQNAPSVDDDLDYVIVTREGRVWLTRLFAVILVRLVKLRGVVLCPNYVLAESALAQERRDLYIAHEIVQMIPINGYDVFQRMRAANPWVSSMLPNANGVFFGFEEGSARHTTPALKRVLERLLSGGVGDWLEVWEYRRKMRRFQSTLRIPNDAAKLDHQHVKGHFDDHGHPVLRQYAERLRLAQMDTQSDVMRIAGD
ncbi:MAG: hypothetical protein U0670_20540 [Anaerolineae bacterium]